MKKVYQTIVDAGRGDCMQATVASLFEKEMKDVPKFIELGEQWYSVMYDFYKEMGYDCVSFYRTEWTLPFYTDALKHDGGVNGFFYGVVPSQTFPEEMGITHAVVVDADLNIVHDPNPNQLALKLIPEDVKYVYVNKKDWYIDYDTKTFRIKTKDDDSSEDN